MILIDTHILLWFEAGDSKLKPSDVKKIIKAQKEEALFLSAISIWEIAMLEQKNRIAFNQPLEQWMEEATEGIKIIPINADIARESILLPNCEHSDPADRFIIATARISNLAILSYDQKILDYMKLGYV
jgi:PIN domain nuclease of toxin-antitoxin system